MRRAEAGDDLPLELRRINEHRKCCEGLLLRDDMDSFAMMWATITKIADTVSVSRYIGELLQPYRCYVTKIRQRYDELGSR